MRDRAAQFKLKINCLSSNRKEYILQINIAILQNKCINTWLIYFTKLTYNVCWNLHY